MGCATIAAAIALRPQNTATILERHGLSEEGWDAIEEHWAGVIKQDTEQGREALEIYDRSYVLSLEAERGPITPEEYARLALAHQRDRAALTRALRDFGLPWGASPRVQRVYAERMAANPALAAQVRAIIAER
jgi:hypothetical protein